MIFVLPGGRLTVVPEEAMNDSDKIITVPANKRWLILSIRIEFNSTGTVGNRTVVVDIRDPSDDVIFGYALGTQAASLNVIYHICMGHDRLVTGDTRGAPLFCPAILEAGYDLHIFDSAAVDAAADDMIIQIMILELDV